VLTPTVNTMAAASSQIMPGDDVTEAVISLSGPPPPD
jgi:hypothetical protein